MAWGVGDTVYVPASKFDELVNHPTALYNSKVLEVSGKRLNVDLPRGSSGWISSSQCHSDIGILILTIGDLQTEPTLLDPLSKSVVQFCRLLVDDFGVLHYKIRSLKELKFVWEKEQAIFSHVILIGHGDQTSIGFHIDGDVSPQQLGAATEVRGAPKKTFISLCCKTGYKSFGGVFSLATICEHFIAPFHSVHGAVASQFCQSLLAYHLLDGETVGVAFRHARQATPGGTSFRLWKDGALKAGQR